MRTLSSTGEQSLAQIAQRHGFSVDATRAMLEAVGNGHGSMAQFGHSEFGGAGQWMRGGMTMVSDMFNHRLKDRVDGLCVDLSNLIAREPDLFRGSGGDAFATEPGAWWPAEFGSPNASGSQNGTRYAYFSGPRRLVIESGGRVQVHDTLDHRIGGVSQQQPGSGSVSFSSQHGPVDVRSLPIVSNGEPQATPASMASAGAGAPSPSSPPPAYDDVFASIEKLAALHAKGILSDDEFSTKKSELLGRL